MSFDKIKQEISKLMKDKKFSGLIALILVLLVAFLVFSFFDKEDKGVRQSEGTLNVNANEQETLPKETSYEKDEREQLVNILQKIDGVGKVDVKMSFESGEEKIIAYDNNTQTTITEEEDSQGGKRKNEQKNDGGKVVMASGKDGSEPFVTKTYKPKVIGVIVTAEGASSSKVKYNIEKAVANLYNLSFDKVSVYPMGNKHIN